ncbi:MAG: hypothetical protein ACFCGT_21210 [Sandaracinaceae bacterium]
MLALRRSAALLALGAALLPGCYLSFERGDAPTTPPRGEACLPALPGDPCSAIFTTVPTGVCRTAEGEVIAFLDAAVPVGGCDRRFDPAEGYALFPIHCLSSPLSRHAAVCAEADVEGPLRFVGDFPSAGDHTFDPPPGTCELARVEEPAGPYAPVVEVAELCVEPSSWCGAPVAFDLIMPGEDPCNGASSAERCLARVDGDRIVVRAETAPSAATVCEPAFGRVAARCVVPPLGEGAYQVVTDEGALLGTIDVGDTSPEGLDVTCRPVP